MLIDYKGVQSGALVPLQAYRQKAHLAELPAISCLLRPKNNECDVSLWSWRYVRAVRAPIVTRSISPIPLRKQSDFALIPPMLVCALSRNDAPLRLPVHQLIGVPCQTTPPSIGRVSTTAADGVPRGVAGRSQTIDVYGSPGPIAGGGFRLSYGHDDGIGGSSSSSSSSSSIVTSCIQAEETVLTAGVLAAALTSANGFVTVVVTEDESPFDDARRFVVDFSAPELGVGTLGVVDPDDDCEWLKCNDGGGIGECDDSGIVVNRDSSVAVQEGAVEVCLVIC